MNKKGQKIKKNGVEGKCGARGYQKQVFYFTWPYHVQPRVDKDVILLQATLLTV